MTKHYFVGMVIYIYEAKEDKKTNITEKKFYYGTGNLKRECNYIKYSEHVTCKKYYENGITSSIINYVHGTKEGKAQQFYETRELKFEYN